jgi:FdhD protein
MWQRTIKIIKYSGFTRSKTNEQLAMEHQKVLIDSTGNTLASCYCSPQYEREWAIGHLFFSQNHIVSIDSLSVRGEKVLWDSTLPTQSLPAEPETTPHLSISGLFNLTSQFQEAAILYKNTGTTDSAAIANTKEILVHSEDISVKGALYKTVGKALSAASPISGIIAITSGKIDLESIQLWYRFGSRIIISRSAPTDLAIDFAIENDLLLIGFARGTRFSIYAGASHIS